MDLGNDFVAILDGSMYDFTYRPWRYTRRLLWTHPNGDLKEHTIWTPESLVHFLHGWSEVRMTMMDANCESFVYIGKNILHDSDMFTYTHDCGWCYGIKYDFYHSSMDGCYYLHSDSMPENQMEEEEEEDYNSGSDRYVDDYHNGSLHHTMDFEDAKNPNIRVGLEIEKEDYDVKTSLCISDFKSLYPKWRKESDGSLDDESGYELISPAMMLDVDKIMDYINAKTTLVEHINAGFSSSCGGHINISDTTKTPYELYDDICGYLPILAALYQSRTEIDFCQIFSKDYMRTSGRKYQMVNIHSNRIEIRIFPAVRNMETMKFRLTLLEYMLTHPAKYFLDVDMDEILRITHKFGIHTTPEKVHNFLNRANRFAKTIEQN
jgi:hypothetical protein